jgi:hypothetical protein
MTKRRQRFGGWLLAIAMAVGVVCLALPTQAEIILGQHTWTSGGYGWTNFYYNWTTPNDGVNQTWLKVTFPATVSGPPDTWYDIVYVPAENLFAGAWTTNMYVHFDFWAEDVAPQSVQLRWKSATNATIWGHSFTPPSGADQTNTYTVGFGTYASDWAFDGDGGLSRYLSDLSTIDWIGVFIARTDDGQQAYGIDDVTLSIPEPPEMIMLGSAVLASLATFRRRRRSPAGAEPCRPPDRGQ